eukprot:g27755.t1
MISTAVTGFAAAAQAAATFLFTWRIMKTVEQEGLGGDYMKAYNDASKWDVMTCIQQMILLLAVFLMLLAGFLIAADFMLAETWPREPSNQSRMQLLAGMWQPCLDNNALNLVIVPVGWLALVITVVAVVGHVVFMRIMASAARAKLEASLAHQVDGQPTPDTIGKSAAPPPTSAAPKSKTGKKRTISEEF